MVRRRRAQLRRQLGAAAGAELISVKLQSQPVRVRRLQDSPAFRNSVYALLAENIRETRQSLIGDARDHLPNE